MAKWIQRPDGCLICSDCGGKALWYVSGVPFARSFGQSKSDYCPHCGAQMRIMCEKCKHFSRCDRANPICGEREDND